jgi:hypothetical protein
VGKSLENSLFSILVLCEIQNSARVGIVLQGRMTKWGEKKQKKAKKTELKRSWYYKTTCQRKEKSTSGKIVDQ